MMLLDALARRGLLSDADRGRAATAIANSPDKPPHLVLLEKGILKDRRKRPRAGTHSTEQR